MATISQRESEQTFVQPTKSNPQQAPRRKPKKKTVAAKGWNSSMKLTRRIHLYSGLFMFPWVLLYGVTGMFFNHPRWFTGGEVQTVSTRQASNSELGQLPTPDQMAAQVVAAINQSLDETAQAEVTSEQAPPQVVLTDHRAANYNNYFTFTVEAEEVEHTITMNPVTGKGEVRTKPIIREEEPTPEAPDPLGDLRRVEVPENAMTMAQAAVPGMLEQMGLPAGEANAGRRSPNLTFSAEVDGQPVVLAYNMGSGVVAATAEGAPSSMDTKSFMQRLHLSRGYSPHYNADWVWALLVDGMFLSMVFWGFSGLFMWWQIKRTRWLGGGFILASLAITVLLVIGMHDNLSVASTRGRGGRGGGGGGGHNHGPPAAAEASDSEAPAMRGNRGRGGGNRGGPGRGGNRGGAGGRRGGPAGGQRGSSSEGMSTEELEAEQEFREFDAMLDGFGD